VTNQSSVRLEAVLDVSLSPKLCRRSAFDQVPDDIQSQLARWLAPCSTPLSPGHTAVYLLCLPASTSPAQRCWTSNCSAQVNTSF
jgi:hypothetical protein